MADKNGTEEITDVEIADGPEDEGSADNNGANGVEAIEKPTLSELADGGLTSGELEIAKKHGLVKGESDGDKGDGGDGNTRKSVVDKPADGSTKKDGETNGKKEEKEDRNRILNKGKSPEQIISEVGAKGTLSPEQEQALMASLSQNGQAMYWAQKKERQKRQKIEAERTTERAETQKKIDELTAQLAEAKKTKTDDEDPLEIDQAEETDPNKRPLTKEDLDKIEADKVAKLAEEEKKRTERRTVVMDALNFQQEDAKERYGEEVFNSAMDDVKDLLARANAGQLDELFPDVREQSRVVRKVKNLLSAFATADEFEEGDYNAADMAIELAKEHPKYKAASKSNANGKKSGETGADGNPEDVDRALKNANRRGSSATLTGGTSRRVPLDELTAEQARKLPTSQWRKLPKSTRERLLQS